LGRRYQKAILVSGYSETDRVKKAQGLGAGACVGKPYILEKMGLAIRRELDKSYLRKRMKEWDSARGKQIKVETGKTDNSSLKLHQFLS